MDSSITQIWWGIERIYDKLDKIDYLFQSISLVYDLGCFHVILVVGSQKKSKKKKAGGQRYSKRL